MENECELRNPMPSAMIGRAPYQGISYIVRHDCRLMQVASVTRIVDVAVGTIQVTTAGNFYNE